MCDILRRKVFTLHAKKGFRMVLPGMVPRDPDVIRVTDEERRLKVFAPGSRQEFFHRLWCEWLRCRVGKSRGFLASVSEVRMYFSPAPHQCDDEFTNEWWRLLGYRIGPNTKIVA